MKKSSVTVMLALVMAGLVALAMGCASGTEAIQTPTTAGTTQGAPALAFDKLSVDLGAVAQDSQTVETFLVINKGNMPLQVGPVGIQVEQGCDAAETVVGGGEIQPGEIVLLPIKLGEHRETGPHRLLVNVSSNDPNRPVYTVSVQFLVTEAKALPVAGPRLRVDKEMIAIGTVPYDSPLYEQFTLRNDGDAPLLVEGLPQVRVEEGC